MTIKFPEPPPGSLITFEFREDKRFAYRQTDSSAMWIVTCRGDYFFWEDLEEAYSDIKDGNWQMIQLGANSGPA